MKWAGERRESEMPLAMKTKVRLTLIVVIGAAVLSAKLSSEGGLSRVARPAAPSLPAAAALPLPAREAAATEQAIRFLGNRVRRDPDDHAAQNRLAGYYLLRARATGSRDDLALAFRSARASLRSVGAERNTGGLAVLAQAELATHAFAEARDHAIELTRLVPGRSTPYQTLGDALLEMGEYDQADAAFRQMARRGGGVEAETRFARLALLRGDAPLATRRLTTALALARDLSPPPGETIAWCCWQIGEVAFGLGDYTAAERQYRGALAALPDYAPALASLSRVRAARGDLATAIRFGERVVHLRPDDVPFVAALGDLYHLAGREKDAHTQYARIEQIGRENEGPFLSRSLALFYADHDLRASTAYASAARDYERRRDIFGADTLAWTALKAGKIAHARIAMKAALRLGTQDARLFYHAGLIERAAGDEHAARAYLRRALALSPQFDPLQAATARKALE
jgi:tetratricopeptide (TPR) repeat protein